MTMMLAASPKEARQLLLADDGEYLFQLEERITSEILNYLEALGHRIKDDYDTVVELMPYWVNYAPVQRGHKPRGEAFPWGEVGEKVLEGFVYNALKDLYPDGHYYGLPYGHDVRYASNEAFIHLDLKSTGPTDNPNEVVASPNQVSGSGEIDEGYRLVNQKITVHGPRRDMEFLPELPPYYLVNGVVLPCITMYLKIVYVVEEIGNQPLDHLELITVPNGLLLFDGPNIYKSVSGLFTPGKDEQHVARKRTRIKLNPLASIASWRSTQLSFIDGEVVRSHRSNNTTAQSSF